ncbi:MAG TPA: hypothetical protein VNC50_14270, partial [Planctomycetia bacterium]|nr:hypothetical protein [Planctomycetia bacterium]
NNTITLPAGDVIEGTALTPDGKPAIGCVIGWCGRESAASPGPGGITWAANDPLASGLFTVADENGRFTAGPFPTGARYILAGIGGAPQRHGAVKATPGDKDALLRLIAP